MFSLDRELLEMTCRLANTLKREGVKKGDRVTIYMPPCPMAVASMLACARIGAIHTVVFAGFSSVALAERIQDGKYFLSSRCVLYKETAFFSLLQQFQQAFHQLFVSN